MPVSYPYRVIRYHFDHFKNSHWKQRIKELEGKSITAPRDVAAIAPVFIATWIRENFLVYHLDARGCLIGVDQVSVGTDTAALIHPKQVYAGAFHLGSNAIVCVHNHPSGNVSPSSEDKSVTRRLATAGEILGIRLFDHVIINHEGDFHSIKESSPDDVEPESYSILKQARGSFEEF
jgi:DNA repair protein RadC